MNNVTTVTLNPCIDHTITIESLSCGGLNIVEKSRRDFGGKGINVSMAVKNLGVETQALTLGFTQSMQIQKEFLDENGIKAILINADGTLRTNIKVFENKNGLMTEFNEKGNAISKDVVNMLESEIVRCATNSDIMVFGGSLCPGIPSNFYNTLITKCKASNPAIRIILDASGMPLVEGIKAKPYIIKPNIEELETAFNQKLNSQSEILSLTRKIAENGVTYVCVSMGKDGAIIVSRDKAFKAIPPKIDVKSVQGAGDSMVAGMCLAILQNKPLDQVLQYAISMASATVLREGTLMGLKSDFKALIDQIQIEII